MKAEELAKEIESRYRRGYETQEQANHRWLSSCKDAAAELRRLSEVEKEYERLKASKEVQCQYAKDVGMTDYRCSGKCQYESLARAVMSDNTGKA